MAIAKRYLVREGILRIFDNYWKKIGYEFDADVRDFIYEKTKEKLSGFEGCTRAKEKTVIAVALYEVQKVAYFRKRRKSKTQTEIGKMIGVTNVTISRKRV